MSKATCPCCLSSFEPSWETVEIGVQIKSAMGEDTSRNLYCRDCGKKIQEKGLEYWVDSLESLIRDTLMPDEQDQKC